MRLWICTWVNSWMECRDGRYSCRVLLGVQVVKKITGRILLMNQLMDARMTEGCDTYNLSFLVLLPSLPVLSFFPEATTITIPHHPPSRPHARSRPFIHSSPFSPREQATKKTQKKCRWIFGGLRPNLPMYFLPSSFYSSRKICASF